MTCSRGPAPAVQALSVIHCGGADYWSGFTLAVRAIFMFWRDTLQRRLAPESLTEVPLQRWAKCCHEAAE